MRGRPSAASVQRSGDGDVCRQVEQKCPSYLFTRQKCPPFGLRRLLLAGRPGTATSCARLLPLSVEGSAGREAGFRCKKTLVCVRAQGRDCRESQKTIQKCIVLGGWQPECLSERTGAPRASVLTLVEIRSVFSHDSAAAWSRRHESLRWRPSCTISHAQAIHRRPDRGDDSERARDHSIDHARQLSSLSANRGDESEFGSPRRSPGIRACNRARRVTEVSEHGL